MEECAENKKTKKYLRAYIIFYILCSLILPPALTFAQQFSDPWNYDDKRGLPLGPAASVLSLKEFEFLVGEKFPQITDALLAQHGENAVVRILESYSDEYPVFIEDNKVMLPVADGVLAEQDPLIPPSLVDPAKHCKPNLFVCDDIFHPDEEKQTHDILVIAGNDVIVSGPAQTGGVSLLILSERFSAFNDSTVTTTPTHYVGSRPKIRPSRTVKQLPLVGVMERRADYSYLKPISSMDYFSIQAVKREKQAYREMVRKDRLL
jgi:hypothetical protein